MNIVVFTGAGLSVESNIPTFEDENGIFAHYDIGLVATAGGYDRDWETFNQFWTELKEFLDSKDGESILVAYRRAANMLRIEERKDSQNYDFEPDPNLFETTEEGDLYKIIKSTSNQLKHSVTNENFKEAMDYLANLRLPLDNFFDQVKVNASEVKIRRNRLSLLASVRGELHQVADFSLIEG